MARKKNKAAFGVDFRNREIMLGTLRMRLPESRWLRTLIGVGLILGGLLGFLPVLGFWMLPLGFLVLSHDSHWVRRQRRRLAVWWASRKARKNPRRPS